jgi:4-hydroxybenzoyl-CoA reductase alpha subunit
MTDDSLRLIGRSLPKVDAAGKVTGQTQYTDDMTLPGMLHARIRRSDRPHARLVRVDTSRAAALPGVRAVLTGADLPAKYGILPVSQDERALALDKVRYVGDPVAAVAAVDERTADEALRLIEVEYEDLPVVLSVSDAVAPVGDDERIHERSERGNIQRSFAFDFGPVEEGFEAADIVRDDVFFYGGNTHLAMEAHCAIAQATPDGRLTLWSSTQIPHYLHRTLAQVLGLPANRIRVIASPVGGGFGGKSDIFPHELVAAKLSLVTGRPVKAALTREESFYCHRGRHPALMRFRLGATRDGRITALESTTYLDGGAYGGHGVASTLYTGALQTTTYQVPAYRFRGLRGYTNKPACGPKRGHGTVQPRFALEVQLDKLAVDLGLSPAELRRRQLVEENSRTVNWLRITSCGLRECLDQVVAASDFERKWGKLPLGRGIGLAVSAFVTGSAEAIYRNDGPHTSVRLEVDRSGGVTAFCGEADIGQGSDTVLATCVAEVLGLSPGDIRLVTADTDLTPVALGSYSSRVTFMMGNAAIAAATAVRDILFRAAASKLGVPVTALAAAHGEIAAGDAAISLAEAAAEAEARWSPISETGSYTPPDLLGPYRGAGVGPSPAYSYSACAVEVEVDPETGILTVDRVWVAHDGGRVMNLALAEGQIEGSVYMGLGEVLMEEQAFRKLGLHRGPSLLDYKSPSALEMPPVEVIMVQTIDPEGPFGAKEAGQGPLLPVPPAVCNAIYDAVGVRIDEVPVTPQKILRALDRRAAGAEPRFGPAAVPDAPFRQATHVDPPPDAPTLRSVLDGAPHDRVPHDTVPAAS